MSALFLLPIVAVVAIGTAFVVSWVVRGPFRSPAVLAAVAVLAWWILWTWMFLGGDWEGEGHADETSLSVLVFVLAVLPSPAVFVGAYLLGWWRKRALHSPTPQQHAN